MKPILKNFINWVYKDASSAGGVFSFYNSRAMPKMTEKQYLESYTGWVYACVSAIADRFSMIDISLQKKQSDGSWKDVDNAPSMDILNYVNPFYTFPDLALATSAYLELDGNAFWMLVRGKNSGKVIEIWPLDPSRVTIVKDAEKFISGYVYQTEKLEMIPLEPNQVIHFKKFNPQSMYRGMGTVEAAAIAIDTDRYATEYQRNFFGNSAMPSSVLSTDKTLTDEQFNRMKGNWDEKYRGVENAHKMVLLEGGLEWKPINPTFKELQFIETRKSSKEEILAYFRTPEVLLGNMQGANYASAQTAEYVFAKYNILPKMRAFVGTLDEFWLPANGIDNKQYKHTFVDPVPENTEEKLSIIASGRGVGGIQPWMSANEAREMFNFEARDGEDEIPEASQIILTPGSQTPEKPEKDDPDEQDDDKGKKTFKKKRDKKSVKELAKIQRAKSAQHDAIQADIPNALKVNLDLNKALKKLVLKNLKEAKSFQSRKKTVLEMLKDANDPKGTLINSVFSGYDGWVDVLKEKTLEQMLKTFKAAGEQTLEIIKFDGTFDLKNPRAVKAIEDHALESTNSYSGSMKDLITEILSAGVDEGQSIDQITADLTDALDSQSQWRAERLARTETADAYSQGSLEGARQSGVVTGKAWNFDEGECDSEICPGNDDEGYISLESAFSSGDDAPPGHPNCECWLTFETADNEE